MEDVTERLKEMFKDENWAVLTATGEISQIHVRQYLEANWSKYTDGLGENEQLKALILCGVHGGIDGKVGGDARNVEDFTNMALRLEREKRSTFKVVDMKNFMEEDTCIKMDELVSEIQNHKPHLIIFSMCFSRVSKVKTALERNGFLANLRLERNLMQVTNGRIVELDEDQKNAIATISHPDNIDKNVVLTGPEGSGKTMLGIELIKVWVHNFVSQNNLTPQDSKVKLRVIFATSHEQQKESQVSLLKTQLESSLKSQPFAQFCKLEFHSVQIKSTLNPNEFNAKANTLHELMKKRCKLSRFVKTFIMVDEAKPGFETSDWAVYKKLNTVNLKNVQVIFSLKHEFDDMKIRMERDENDDTPIDADDEKIQTFKDVVVAKLGTNKRCSNQIRNLAYYLLIHSPVSDNMYKVKRFGHEESSFDANKPVWWETEDAQSFVHEAESGLWPFDNLANDSDGNVILIYDRNLRDNDERKVVEGLCKKFKWEYQSKDEIVGVEFSTVIIFDLDRFHFEAFTRCINHLIIVTTEDTNGPLKHTLNSIKTNLHDDEECKWNCDLNQGYFKQELLPCKFLLEQPREPSDLIDWKEGHQTSDSPFLENDIEEDVTIDSLPWWKKHPNYFGWISFSIYFIFCTLISALVAYQYMFWNCPFGYHLDENNSCREGLFILVTTGAGDGGYGFNKTEILDLRTTNFECTRLDDFPIGILGGGGGVVEGTPLICGGWQADDNTIADHCYKVNDGTWERCNSLKKSKAMFGNGDVVIKDKLLINGGISSNTTHFKDRYNTKSSDLIGLRSNASLFDLPLNLTEHCNILINDTTLLITGGWAKHENSPKPNYTAFTETYFYHFNDSEESWWEKGPPLQIGRLGHGCVKAFVGNRTVLLVTGGVTSGHHSGVVHTDTIEYLDLHSNHLQWKSHPYIARLPMAIDSHSMITSPDNREIYIIGGKTRYDYAHPSNKILKSEVPIAINPKAFTFKEIPTRLKYARYGHVAFPISLDIVKQNCENTKS